MSKRYFRIESQGTGGELVVGTISQEFLDHWKDMDKDELAEFIHDQDEYEDSPELPAEEWNEVDDIEHITSAMDDCQLTVVEVDEGGEEIGEECKIHTTGDCVYSREGGALISDIPDNIKEDDEYVPAVSFFNIEKGLFFEATVETSGEDFDAEKLRFGVLESYLGCLIEQIWYDKELIEIDHDVVSTRGKGMEVALGYINMKWQRMEDASNYQDGGDRVKCALSAE
jgi:hypothetical protein